jgi:hypothetical protein
MLLLGTNNSIYEVWRAAGFDKKDVLEREGRWLLQVILTAHSKRELEYKMRILEEILNEEGGKEFLSAVMVDVVRQAAYAAFITGNRHGIIFKPPAGDFSTSFGHYVSWEDAIRKCQILCNEVRRSFVEEGKIVDDGLENMWGGPEEQYFHSHHEGLYCADQRNPESVKAAAELARKSVEIAFDNKLVGSGEIMMILPVLIPPRILEGLSNFRKWSEKIKSVFDPRQIAEGWPYMKLEELPERLKEDFERVVKK